MGIRNCFTNKHSKKWAANLPPIPKLIEEAKRGDAKAILELRLRYSVTALWDGERLVPISELQDVTQP